MNPFQEERIGFEENTVLLLFFVKLGTDIYFIKLLWLVLTFQLFISTLAYVIQIMSWHFLPTYLIWHLILDPTLSFIRLYKKIVCMPLLKSSTNFKPVEIFWPQWIPKWLSIKTAKWILIESVDFLIKVVGKRQS